MLKIFQSSVLPLMLVTSSIAPASTITMADIIARAVDNASAVERAIADLETARPEPTPLTLSTHPMLRSARPTADSLKKNSQS